jgi:hypothetical protein
MFEVKFIEQVFSQQLQQLPIERRFDNNIGGTKWKNF